MTRLLPAAAVLTALAVTGCTSDGGRDPDDLAVGTVVAGSAATAAPAPTGAGTTTGGAGTAPGGSPTGAPELVSTMRAGVWPVADVGEIEFALTDRGLELVAMRPDDGWDVVDEEVGPDEIEVDLRRTVPAPDASSTSTSTSTSDRTTVEVGLQGGILEIEVDRVLDPPPAGPLPLGDAGSVELLVVGQGVQVGEVRVADGWRETRRSGPQQDAELGLRRSGPGVVETWEVDARLDDGRLEVLTDHEIEGPLAP